MVKTSLTKRGAIWWTDRANPEKLGWHQSSFVNKDRGGGVCRKIIGFHIHLRVTVHLSAEKREIKRGGGGNRVAVKINHRQLRGGKKKKKLCVRRWKHALDGSLKATCRRARALCGYGIGLPVGFACRGLHEMSRALP